MDTKKDWGDPHKMPESEVQVGKVEPGRCYVRGVEPQDWELDEYGRPISLIPLKEVSREELERLYPSKQVGADEEDSGR